MPRKIAAQTNPTNAAPNVGFKLISAAGIGEAISLADVVESGPHSR